MKQKLWQMGRYVLCLLCLCTLCTVVALADEPVVQTRTEGIEAFPESYRPYLQALQEAHPNWRFVAFDTGLTWDAVLDGETAVVSNNLVRLSTATSWKSLAPGSFDWKTSTFATFDGGRYHSASREIVAYYMDPRNSLDQVRYLFQFEQLTFDPETQTEAGVEAILKGTFMSGKGLVGGTEEAGGLTYAQVFMSIAEELNVSPYHLAARVRQEQGSAGTSAMISGTYSGYKGYYNYFNISASGSTQTAILENGLKRAKNEGWDTPYKSLLGGARVIANQYIGKGQDTLYLEKFDVAAPGGLYSHQYMQNLTAAYTESVSVYNSYHSMGLIDGSFTFVIPVYRNMPETACPQPTADGNPNYKLQSLGVSDAVLDPVFDPDTRTYIATVGNDVHTVTVSAVAYAQSARIAGTGSIGLAVGENVIPITVTAERGDTCTYTLRLTRLSDGEEIIAMGSVQVGVNLRSGPGIEHEILTTVPAGRTVSILAEENGWYQVIYGQYTGYMSTEYVTAFQPAKGLTLSTDALEVTVGTPGTLLAITDPDPCDTPVLWKTDNAAIATVENGIVTGYTTGTVTITAYTENGLSASCTVTVKETALFMGTVNVKASGSLNVREKPGGTAFGKLYRGDRVTVVEYRDGWCRVLYQDTTGWVDGQYIAADPVASTGIELDAQTGLLYPSETLQLGVLRQPVYSNDELTWTSADPTVAMVENGLVTALREGETVITVTTASGFSATCTVTVKPGAAGIVLERTEAAMLKGESLPLQVTLLPEGVVDLLIWTSENPAVAAVEDGVITAVGSGSTVITVTTSSGKTASCAVTVTAPATSVTLGQSALFLPLGSTGQLTAVMMPEDCTDDLTWQSENPAVVTVENGLLTGVSLGTANVTVTTTSGKTATCTVTVIIPAESVTLDRQDLLLYRDESAALTATILPAESTDTLTWSTSDPNVVTVNEGQITVVGVGKAVITVTTTSGQTATCTVRVKDRVLFTGTVNVKSGSSLNVRNKPDSDGKSLGKLSRGTAVAAVEVQDGWFRIEYQEGYGWVSGDYILRDPVAAESITIITPSLTLDVGQQADVLVQVLPVYHTEVLTWVSSNPAAVTVENGRVTAVGVGEAVITATIASGETVTCTVTVAHHYTAKEVPHSCTEDGYTLYTCTDCGASYKENIVPAPGHALGEWSVTQEASCAQAGSKQSTCGTCGHVETAEIPATAHTFADVVTPPTCTADGYTTHTCTVCGHVAVDTYVPAAGHALGEWSVTEPATCTDPGSKQRACANCDHVETGIVSATGHSMGAWSVIEPATCTDKGTEQRKCANCTHTETRDIAAKGHNYKHVVTPPTCTAEGYTTHTCSTCSHSYKDTFVPAKGHSMGSWSVTKPASCTDKGSEQRKCANCTHTETRDIAAKGHNYKHVVTPPTCTAQGYTTHTCSTCNHSYKDTPVSAKGHSMGAWSVTKPATCTDKGTEQRKCTNCSHTESRDIAAKVHNYKAVVTKPTCTAEGYTTHTCSTCKHSYVDTKVPAKGHIYSNDHDRTCDTCGATREVDEEVLRVYGSNRFDTAFGAANLLKETLGVDKFDNVIVACGTNFADALAGSYLGKVKNAPILLVQPNMVPTVRAYIEANLKPGGTVYLLGGETIVPGGVSEGLNQFVTKRLWGANRYETNLAILEEAGVTGGEILVCTGYGFADSLSASAVGKPILLVDKRLDAKQQAFLAGLRNDRYVIVGGVGAVNEVVEDSLKGYGAIERLAGANRFTTSVMVAERFFDSPSTAVVAYAANFPDGLCGGPLAAAMGGPLLLTANNDAHITAAYTEANGIRDGVVLGGPGLISDAAVRLIFSMEDGRDIVIP